MAKTKRTLSQELLFEIGVEEIPSDYFEGAVASILKKAPELISECGWTYGSLQVETTPRRFVIHATDFAHVPAQEEEKIGPLKEQAYRDGKATLALKGFLKNTGSSERDVTFKDSPKGPRIAVRVKQEFKPLRHFFETLPRTIDFPKLMRWEANRYAFTRPIRWTFAFVGSKKQAFQIGNVKSGDATFGHRFLSRGKLKVRGANLEVFRKLLLKNHVILSVEERIKRIRKLVKNVSEKDESLIQKIAHLVEEPVPITGSFDKGYLKLPQSVLITCMSKHQKIFAQYTASGALANQFIAIMNGPRRNTKAISKNYESVLKSRLEDAQFFFAEDQKTRLEAKVDQLKEMVFLGSLGSYHQKMKRLESVTGFLGKEAGLSGEVIANAKRAAHLAKADLNSHLVYEFPELQGVAGAEYAKCDGEATAVARAIQAHYLPSSLSENFKTLKAKQNLEGALLGVSDRLDLLVGACGLGIELSSSQDPYALRRSAGGIAKIVRAHQFKFSLRKMIQEARNQYGNLFEKPHTDLAKLLIPFFKERVAYELQAKAGTRAHEVLQGIFKSDCDDLSRVYEKFDDLTKNLEDESFIRACKVMERTGNILRGAKGKITDRIEPSLFQDPLEQTLHDLLQGKAAKIEELTGSKAYSDAARFYGDLFYQPVHDFFDQVMVNVEDPKVRTNRQALVKKINQLCASQVADLSLVTNL